MGFLGGPVPLLSGDGLRSRLSRYILQPIARALARTPLTPNALTLLGLLVSAGAAYALARGGLVPGGVIFLVGSVLDALDGELARVTGRASAFGAFLDSTVDRVQEGLVFLGLLLYFLAESDSPGAVLTFLALSGSFLVSYTRARAEGLGLQGEVGFVARPARVILLGLGLLVGWPHVALGAIALLSAVTALQRGAAVWSQTR